ncbi:hypothetical protein AB4254_11955 [Vibrio breoganii]
MALKVYKLANPFANRGEYLMASTSKSAVARHIGCSVYRVSNYALDITHLADIEYAEEQPKMHALVKMALDNPFQPYFSEERTGNYHLEYEPIESAAKKKVKDKSSTLDFNI